MPSSSSSLWSSRWQVSFFCLRCSLHYLAPLETQIRYDFLFFENSLIFSLSKLANLCSASWGSPFPVDSVTSFQAFSNFSHKISLIAPYVWPKKSVGLQIRVAICLLLLVLGRLINVALPLYSKWIGRLFLLINFSNLSRNLFSVSFLSKNLDFSKNLVVLF